MMGKVFLFRIVSKDVWSSIDSSLLFPLIGDVSSYTALETGGMNVVIHMRGRALPGIEGGLEGGPNACFARWVVHLEEVEESRRDQTAQMTVMVEKIDVTEKLE